jgi:hypothetical protein
MPSIPHVRMLFFSCAMLTAGVSRAGDTTRSLPTDSCESIQGEYDPTFALWLSMASTFGGAALGSVFFISGAFSNSAYIAQFAVGGVIAGAALIVGPPTGHLYVKNYTWPLVRMGARLAFTGLGVWGAIRWMESAFCSEESEGGGEWGLPLMIVSSIVFVSFMAWDFATVKRDARRANAAKKRDAVAVSLAPAVFGTRGRTGGLMVVGCF